MKRGVFWLIDGSLYCYPFDGSITEGIARSGNTYNHRKLWEHIHPVGGKAFDYYPRGRVEITAKGNAVIYMSPHIGGEYLPEISRVFEIIGTPAVKYDHSEHYHCHFD